MCDRCDASQQLTIYREKHQFTHHASRIAHRLTTAYILSRKASYCLHISHLTTVTSIYSTSVQQESKATMNKTAQDDKTHDDIDIYEESSCSESSQTLPGPPQEGEVAQEGKEMKDRIIKKEEKCKIVGHCGCHCLRCGHEHCDLHICLEQ
jgi:hypothetical protein